MPDGLAKLAAASEAVRETADHVRAMR